MPLQRIALARGLGNLNTMRSGFVRNLGAAPLDYRKSFSERLCIWRQLKSKIACLEGDWCIDAAPARSEGAAWQERDLGHLGDVAEVQANVTRVTWLECLLCRVEPESASWVLTKLDRIDDRAVAGS